MNNFDDQQGSPNSGYYDASRRESQGGNNYTYNYNYNYGDNRSKPKKKGDSDWVSWLVITLLLINGAWFIALPWLFIKLFAPDGGSKTRSAPPLWETVKNTAAQNIGNRTSTSAYRARTGANTAQSARQTGAPGPQQTQSKAQYAAEKAIRSPKASSFSSIVLLVMGIILAIAGVFGSFEPLSALIAGEPLASLIQQLLQFFSFAVAGGGMITGSFVMRRALKRYSKYLAIIGGSETVALDDISKKLGYTRKRVEKDLERMIDKGMFGPTAYLNRELGYFFRSGEADAELTAQREAAMRKTKEARNTDDYSAILANIRHANDLISDPVLSEKIDRLEAITAGIFAEVKKSPEKLDRISTFLNYYLPTTQKLLDSYARFEATGVSGENMGEAKARIEATMDSIVQGFERQLDSLYEDVALDIDTDIKVMQTMMNREASGAASDFNLGGSAAAQQKKPE